jgi:hypothetical protein
MVISQAWSFTPNLLTSLLLTGTVLATEGVAAPAVSNQEMDTATTF